MKKRSIYTILIFFICLLPFALTVNTVDTHDGYYRDGAIMMLQDHDWLVPKTAMGQERFLKPPLSYWTIALSFALFGIDFFAARLPSMLAACGALSLTYLCTKRLANSKSAANLSVLMVLSNFIFILSSTYSHPDMWLCFFSLVSIYGFLRLIAFEKYQSFFFWLAYGGAAGAVFSKGLLGVGIVLFAFLFVLIKKRNMSSLRQIIHFPILFISFLPVILWFSYIVYTHGTSAWNTFFSDQVSDKVRGAWYPFVFFFFYLSILFMSFFPWTLSCFEFLFRNKKVAVSIFRNTGYQFILAAILLMLCCFAFGVPVRSRYILPLLPLFSMVLGPILERVLRDQTQLFFSLKRGFLFSLVGLFFLGIAVVLSSQEGLNGNFIDPSMVVAIMIFLSLVILYILVLKIRLMSLSFGIALAMMFCCQTYFIMLRPIIDHREDIYMTPRVVDALQKVNVDASFPILFVNKSLVGPSLLRTALHGKWVVVSSPEFTLDLALKYNIVLLPEYLADLLADHGYHIEPIPMQERSPLFAWIVLATEAEKEHRKRSAKKYVLATRENTLREYNER